MDIEKIRFQFHKSSLPSLGSYWTCTYKLFNVQNGFHNNGRKCMIMHVVADETSYCRVCFDKDLILGLTYAPCAGVSTC